MSIREFAQVCGVSTGLAYELAKQNRLPVKVLRLGDKRMFLSRRAVEEWLSGKQDDSENGDSTIAT
jgi:predicted DNA-binding transcriptional regulator AlpA